MSTEIMIASTTFSSKENAVAFCQKLVEEKLVACAQVSGPINSIYQWKGKICEDVEWEVKMKTSVANINKVKETVHRVHNFEVPQWICWKAATSAEYGRWVQTGN